MAARVSIRKDPRWHDFVVRYRDRSALFAEEVCMVVPSWQQKELLGAMDIQGNRVSVRSGTGTGKSSITAVLILNFITSYIDSRVCITANKVQQVVIGVFKNLSKYWKLALIRFPWLGDYFTLTDTSFYCNEAKLEWSVAIKGYRVGQEEALAGEHAAHMMYIVDEASGLGDAAFDKITGTLTEYDNRLLLLSQPTRNEGLFYRSHHDLAHTGTGKRADGTYQTFVMNSEDSPNVTNSFITGKYLEFGGRDSVEYKIRVRGEFADDQDGNLISRSLVEAGLKAKVDHEEDWGYIFACDVAGGNHRDSCVLTIARVSGYGETRIVQTVLTKEMAGDVGAVDFARILVEEYIPNYQNVTVGVDKGAMGGEMIIELERHNIPNVVPISWGAKVHAKSGRAKYFNKRAYASCMVRDALRHGNIQLFHGTRQQVTKLTNQFINLPFKYVDNGDGLQLQMMPKPEMAKKGIKSPDIFDTYAFLWMCDFIPVGDTEISQELLADSGGAFGDYGEYANL